MLVRTCDDLLSSINTHLSHPTSTTHQASHAHSRMASGLATVQKHMQLMLPLIDITVLASHASWLSCRVQTAGISCSSTWCRPRQQGAAWRASMTARMMTKMMIWRTTGDQGLTASTPGQSKYAWMHGASNSDACITAPTSALCISNQLFISTSSNCPSRAEPNTAAVQALEPHVCSCCVPHTMPI